MFDEQDLCYHNRKPFETVMYRESNRKMINTTILMNRKCHIPVIFAEKKSLIYRKKEMQILLISSSFFATSLLLILHILKSSQQNLFFIQQVKFY